MGFCEPEEYKEFMRQAPEFERNLVRSGIHLIKFWFSVSREEQKRRFKEREATPAKAMEAFPHRQGFVGQMGRLHEGKGSNVLLHGHSGVSVDSRQIGLQEKGSLELHEVRAT